MYDFKINDLKVEFSKHASDRLKERNVTKKEIAWTFHLKYKDIKNYKYINKILCYRSKGLSIIFEMKNKTIYIITVMDFENKNLKKVKII